MSVGGLGGGGELRELFALIGRNIAGDPLPPDRAASPPSTPTASAAPPSDAASQTAGAWDDRIADDGSPPFRSPLAGLRAPRPGAADADRMMLAAVRSLLLAAASRSADGTRADDRSGDGEFAGGAPDAVPADRMTAEAQDRPARPFEPNRSNAGASVLSRTNPTSLSPGAQDAPSADADGLQMVLASIDGEPSAAAPAHDPGAPLPADRQASASGAGHHEVAAARPARFDAAGGTAAAKAIATFRDDPMSIVAGEGGLAARLADAETGLDLLALDRLFANPFPSSADAAGGRSAHPDGQTERAGVLASFVLNAAMIPGWPPPRPIEGVPPAVATFAAGRADLTEAEREFVLLLGKLFHGPNLLERLLRRLEQHKKRSKLLAALALILTEIEDFAATVSEELCRMEDALATQAASTGVGRQRLALR